MKKNLKSNKIYNTSISVLFTIQIVLYIKKNNKFHKTIIAFFIKKKCIKITLISLFSSFYITVNSLALTMDKYLFLVKKGFQFIKKKTYSLTLLNLDRAVLMDNLSIL